MESAICDIRKLQFDENPLMMCRYFVNLKNGDLVKVIQYRDVDVEKSTLFLCENSFIETSAHVFKRLEYRSRALTEIDKALDNDKFDELFLGYAYGKKVRRFLDKVDTQYKWFTEESYEHYVDGLYVFSRYGVYELTLIDGRFQFEKIRLPGDAELFPYPCKYEKHTLLTKYHLLGLFIKSFKVAYNASAEDIFELKFFMIERTYPFTTKWHTFYAKDCFGITYDISTDAGYFILKLRVIVECAEPREISLSDMVKLCPCVVPGWTPPKSSPYEDMPF